MGSPLQEAAQLRAETEEICSENSQLIEQQAKLQQAVRTGSRACTYVARHAMPGRLAVVASQTHALLGPQVAALQAEAKDSETEAERQKLQLEEAREEGDRLRGQIVEVRPVLHCNGWGSFSRPCAEMSA
jgi:hypothetical protein